MATQAEDTPILSRPALLSRIVAFETNEFKRAVDLASVSQSFRNTVTQYAPSMWEAVVAKADAKDTFAKTLEKNELAWITRAVFSQTQGKQPLATPFAAAGGATAEAGGGAAADGGGGDAPAAADAEAAKPLNALGIATIAGAEQQVKAIFDLGGDSNGVDSQGFLLFLRAAMSGNATLVGMYLDKAGSAAQVAELVNTAHSECGQHTALHHACLNNNVDVVKLLLEKGADVNKKSGLELPPLIYAARNVDCIQALIAHVEASGGDVPAFVKTQGPDQRGALFDAVIQDRADSVRLLVAKGADPEAADGHGCTAASLAKVDAVREALGGAAAGAGGGASAGGKK